jgi:hypothetical protein
MLLATVLSYARVLQAGKSRVGKSREGCRRSADHAVRLTSQENIAYDASRLCAATDLGYPSNGYALALEEGKVRAGLAGGG